MKYAIFGMCVLLLSCGSVEHTPSHDEQNLALLQHNVNDSDPALNRGKKLLVEGKYAEAEQAIRSSKAIEAPFYLALALQEQHKIDEAATLFKKAILHGVKTAESYYNLAMIAHKKGDDNTAARLAEQALQIDSNHAGAHFILGSFAFDANRFNEALKHFTVITRVAPDNEAGWSGVVSVLALKKQWERIWNIRNDLINFPELRIYVAHAAEQAHHQKEAVILLKDKLTPDIVRQEYIVLLAQSDALTQAVNLALDTQKKSPGTLLVDRNKQAKMVLFLNPSGKLLLRCGTDNPIELSASNNNGFSGGEHTFLTHRSLVDFCLSSH